MSSHLFSSRLLSSRFGLAWIMMLALAAGTSSCSNSKTVVLVKVEGTVTGVYELHVKVTAGALTTSIFVKSPTGGEIDLPSDFTLEMDRSRQGALDMTIDARDKDKVVLATGSAGLAAIVVGEENNLTVVLGAPPPPPPDGGGETDAGTDAGEDAATPMDAEVDAGAAMDAGADGGAADVGDDGGDPVGLDAPGLVDAELDVADDV